MPGNEAGDRVHNFFGQENLSQGQYHSQGVDGNWQGLSNNPWVGSQRQIGAPFIPNLKNFNVQQSDSERGHTGQSEHPSHGLNLSQFNLRHESGRNHSQNQQSAVNGFVSEHQVFLTRQNEANFMGVDTDSDRHSLSSRGISMLESQQGNGPELYKKNLVRLDATESPVNYDFLGGQHQINGRHPSMLQSLRRQQSGINEMQLLQQQVMLTQMQELQRQQQLQQLEARQQISLNQASPTEKQTVGNHSASPVNGIPINEASNFLWQPEVMAANSNWLQRAASPVFQGSSSGLMLSPDQGHALRLMGLVPQQADQSLYGLPVSSSRGTPNQYSHVQVNKPAVQQVSSSGNSFPVQQYAAISGQTSGQDVVSRQDIQGMLGHSTGQGLNSGLNMGNLQEVSSQQSNAPVQKFHGRQELVESSEPSKEKMEMQVPPSHSVATLDPTEEKILFGSDDNPWDSFGRNAGGFNMLDGKDSFGGFPSIQSGSWSALMQSAVAETSNSDIGLREEWSGLSFRNTESSPGNERPLSIDRGKQQLVWAENNLQVASNLNSRPFLRLDDVNQPDTTTNSGGLPAFQQSGFETPSEQDDRLQTSSLQRSIPQFLERGKWLDCSPQQKVLAEGNHTYGHFANSLGPEINSKSMSGPWTHKHTLLSSNSSGDPLNKPNGWNSIDSVSHDGNATLENHDKGNLSETSQSMHGMGHLPGTWNSDSVSNSSVGLGHVNSATGNPQVYKGESSMSSLAAVPNSGTTMGNQQSTPLHSNSHSGDMWKNAGSSRSSRGNEDPSKTWHHLTKNPHVLESSGNNSTERGVSEMCDMQITNYKDSSTEGIHSNRSHHRIGGMRENVWLDASDSGALPGSKPKSSGQVNRRPGGPRKFQYHPMGDLDVDVEPSYGNKHVSHSPPIPQQAFQALKGQDQGYLGQSKFGRPDVNHIDMEKVGMKDLNEIASETMLPDHVPKTSAPFSRSIDNYEPNKSAPSSQNMLELLHKVDQSREHGIATQINSPDRNLSCRIPQKETFDVSVVQPQQNRSAASQGFGLQLAPPAQRVPILDFTTSHSSTQEVFSASHVALETVDKGNNWSTHTQSVNSQESSQGELGNSISGTSGQLNSKAFQQNVLGKFSKAFPSGFPFSRFHTQNQSMTGLGGQVIYNQSVNIPVVGRSASHSNQMDESCERAQTSQSALTSFQDTSVSILQKNVACPESSTQQNHAGDPASQTMALEAAPASQPSGTSSNSQQNGSSKVLLNIWTGISSKQHSLGSFPANIPSHPQPDNNFETISAPQKLGGQDTEKIGSDLSDNGVHYMFSPGSGRKEQLEKENSEQKVLPESTDPADKNLGASYGKESLVKHLPDAPHTSAVTQRDIEAFGRSLRPNNLLHQNYSLLNQVQATRSTDIDPTNQSIKRFKGQDSRVDVQQVASKGGQQLSYEYNNMVKDVSVDHSSVPSADPKMSSFTSKPGDGKGTNVSSQDMPGFVQINAHDYSSINNATSVRGEHSLVSPRMAPSWFEQFGTFKNGKILPVYDVQRMAPSKVSEQSLIVEKQSDSLHAQNSVEQVDTASDTNQLANARQSAIPVASEHVNSNSLQLDAPEQTLVVMRPKKRKTATSELVPWHKELTHGFQRLYNISAAELDWARSTNRLIEKVEDEAELNEDLPQMLKSRRRLILTTQLMQQLLRPPPATVLSADVKLHYENVAYSVARLALGDACGAISCSGSETLVPPSSRNLILDKLKSSEKIGDQYFLKVTEELIGRARKLENELLRLDSRASILDLRVEYQDLERFSVINRFAKFHGRGQTDGTETSSSDATASAQKSFPQKYVTGVPMPKNFPDRVQCLSL
ncbi:putative Dentin sialophosphoprotein-like protein [Quillaja saponaria]|uniref:Dentin sialophosphoprotein-like protein n=1 Tax=Quillaja saponaria TaxID=32244 RepID=A0AAD7QC46_QUISA|nr:putative Dentin sialophosphoprotein-like protein [Quillaja saponaria]